MSKLTGYIGTYTNGESEGIYSFELDTVKGRIEDIKVVAKLDNPTYLCFSEDHEHLYSVIKEGEFGGIAAFSVDHSSGQLQRINAKVSAGSPPCHVSIDKEEKLVFTTNYHKGTVESYIVNSESGEIKDLAGVAHHEGHGPDPRQEKAHTHFAGMTPDGKHLAVVELGCDLIITYSVADNGELTAMNRMETAPGSGPRHLAFHPKDPSMAYVMTEFSSEVIVLTYDDSNGSFRVKQTIKTIPEDFIENNQGSAIHVSSDGRFVYAGNRGHNSIAIFKVDEETGKISLVDRVSTEGDWPRDFVIDPTEAFIVATNQNSSNLTLYSRNSETGMLELLQKDIKVPNPVCVKF
ncbi:6-phosphogluconolactonase [Pullulanibacillus pueri]|uniref:6-phosphogluconolactonase n=1 Tax=Pullulanibacillus pueri TaxID=1437324 RepID=A0A8J2ZX94_9BACL|nr:lactonase family protein [Pullulanibacillus pueri]MBM7682652.1 6-phosphogluconolactonase [Pullulanibacillus pueri]GGH82656.1 hypothetical protein GCM10007096_22370 [Pullulanibacillus pueri]